MKSGNSIPLLPRGAIGGRPLINRAVRLNDGTWAKDGAGGEVLHWRFYDRAKLISTQSSYRLFGAKVNDTRDSIKLTLADTNIQTSPPIPQSQKFTMHELLFQYVAGDICDDAEMQSIIDLLRQTYVQFQIESKVDMFQITLDQMCQGGILAVHAPAATIGSRGPLTIFQGCWKLQVPIVLQNITSFNLDLTMLTAPNSGLDADYLRFVLDGELARR